MKLPDVRNELHVIAATLIEHGWEDTGQRLAHLAEQTRRRSPMKRAEPRARHMTDEVKERIRLTHQAHPGWSNRRIGLDCGVDGGRVSEVLRGFRQ